ncbi:hypothetical protein BHM03_00040321 [Ensete ventricosum]|nr:hypothetical protein BHM03_00040321 [Ensete ventricosum]
MQHGAEARSFPWTEIKDMNSYRGKSEIISFHGFFTLMGRLILHGAKDEGSFEAHVPYFINAFNEETKVIQLEDAKLGSKGLARDKRTQRRVLLKNMPQYCHSSCHKGSGTQRRLCWWGIEAQDPDNGAPILVKYGDFESY